MSRPGQRLMWWKSWCLVGASTAKRCSCFLSLTPFHQFSTGLLSGPAESGKSTLIKQIKIIYSHGFSKPELISFKVPSISCTMLSPCSCMFQSHDVACFDSQPAVLDNLLTSMKFVLQGMGMLRINLANKKNKASRDGAGSSFGQISVY